MTPLILAVDSGLNGAFVWMRGGVVLHHVLTRTLVKDGAIDMQALGMYSHETYCMFFEEVPRIAYLEEPFNPGMAGRANSVGFAGSCMRFGRLQGWLESWGYEVRSVRPQTWQREILDLARFEVRTEKACKPRLAEGFALDRVRRDGVSYWRLRGGDAETFFSDRLGSPRAEYIQTLAKITAHSPIEGAEGCITRVKTVLSHDTKSASVAYAREHYPGVELVPPQAPCHVGTKHAPPTKPHDGLADALCIGAWASKKETP